ncbi:hypothetical protein CRU92_10335 [Arcobacter sp. FW59]|nr:hypothetical protein CRU92_10335 [Arcobacter sp. FW59]
MPKFLLFFILTTFAFSSSIDFEEEKYVNALQTSVYKYGNIDIKDDIITVSYKNLSSSYIFYEDYFILKDKDNEQKLSYDEKVELSLFYKLISFIYKDRKDGVEEFFKLQNIDENSVLIPNEYVSNAIEKIEFKKDENRLKFLKIYFKNEDYIKIVQK